MSNIVILIPKDNVAYNFRAELFLKLHELGHAVYIVCPYGEKLEFFRSRGIHIIDLPIDRRGTSILNDLKLTREYIRIIKETKADLVLTYTTKCSVYGGFACEATHTPYIVNTAGIMQNGDKLSALEKFILELYRVALRKASCLMYQNDHECELLNNILRHKVHYRRIPGSGVNLALSGKRRRDHLQLCCPHHEGQGHPGVPGLRRARKGGLSQCPLCDLRRL